MAPNIIAGSDIYGCFISEMNAAYNAHIAHGTDFSYSAGIILNTNGSYVTVHQTRSHYQNFPKGHIRPQTERNNPMRAAEREFEEETGVKINIANVPKTVFRVGKCIYFMCEIDIDMAQFRGIKNNETNAVICVKYENLDKHAFKGKTKTSYSFRECVKKIIEIAHKNAPSAHISGPPVERNAPECIIR
jgi:hypothetical protein